MISSKGLLLDLGQDLDLDSLATEVVEVQLAAGAALVVHAAGNADHIGMRLVVLEVLVLQGYVGRRP